jgi:hypothetical protein
MLNIETRTKLPPADVMKRVGAYFRGLKLKALEETPEHAFYEGGGGTVEVSVCQEKGVTKVDFISREWDYPVKEFIETLPQKVKT